MGKRNEMVDRNYIDNAVYKQIGLFYFRSITHHGSMRHDILKDEEEYTTEKKVSSLCIYLYFLQQTDDVDDDDGHILY